MPVIAEIIHNPPAQDSQDLHLIYETGDGPLPTELQLALAGEGILVAGRFNSRLLGAFVLRPQQPHCYSLERLQVRELTRRRGVARQLLQVALRKLPEEVHRIQVDLAEHPELAGLFTEVGFTGTDSVKLSWSRPE